LIEEDEQNGNISFLHEIESISIEVSKRYQIKVILRCISFTIHFKQITFTKKSFNYTTV